MFCPEGMPMEILNLAGLCSGFLGALILACLGVPPLAYNKNGTVSMLPPDAPKDPDGTNYTYIRRKYFQYRYGFRIGVGLLGVGFFLQEIGRASCRERVCQYV